MVKGGFGSLTKTGRKMAIGRQIGASVGKGGGSSGCIKERCDLLDNLIFIIILLFILFLRYN
jgi:hypothetical protein